MTRNIYLTFEEWSAIKEEINPKDYWTYHLNSKEVATWKRHIKQGYGEQKCFSRAGVWKCDLDKITTPYLYNRLLQEDYRQQDMGMMSITGSEEYINQFISWATACVPDVDMNTTKEQWIEISKLMKDAIEKTNKRCIFAREMVEIFQSVTVEKVA